MEDLSVAHYYMGNAYVKLGRSDKAIDSYNQVITLNTSPGLVNYAKQGVSCLQNIEACKNPDTLDGFVHITDRFGGGGNLIVFDIDDDIGLVNILLNVEDDSHTADFECDIIQSGMSRTFGGNFESFAQIEMTCTDNDIHSDISCFIS